MADDSDVLSLQQTPGIFYTPFSMFKNLSKNKSLLKNLVSRDFKVNYYGHVLGYFWSLLEPLALTGIFYLVFIILRGDSDTLLPLKIMIGILIFTAFSKTLSSCTSCLVSNSALIQQVYFPREIFPTAISGSVSHIMFEYIDHFSLHALRKFACYQVYAITSSINDLLNINGSRIWNDDRFNPS